MFWMTPDEKKKRLQKELTMIQDERDVAEALFGMLQKAESTVATFIPDQVYHDKPSIGTCAKSAATSSNLEFDEDEMNFEQTIEQAVDSIVNDGDPFGLDLKDDFLVEGMKDRVHEIPVQDVSVCAKIDRSSFDTDQKDVLILGAVEKGANVIPVDNKDRDKKERERGIKLNRKNSNSILKYTVEHKGGIEATERKKRKGNHSHNNVAAGNISNKKRREVKANKNTRTITVVKRKNNKNDDAVVATKMVCFKFCIF